VLYSAPGLHSQLELRGLRGAPKGHACASLIWMKQIAASRCAVPCRRGSLRAAKERRQGRLCAHARAAAAARLGTSSARRARAAGEQARADLHARVGGRLRLAQRLARGRELGVQRAALAGGRADQRLSALCALLLRARLPRPRPPQCEPPAPVARVRAACRRPRPPT